MSYNTYHERSEEVWPWYPSECRKYDKIKMFIAQAMWWNVCSSKYNQMTSSFTGFMLTWETQWREFHVLFERYTPNLLFMHHFATIETIINIKKCDYLSYTSLKLVNAVYNLTYNKISKDNGCIYQQDKGKLHNSYCNICRGAK